MNTLYATDGTPAGTGTVMQGGPIDFQIDSQPTPLAGWDRLLPAFAGHQVSGTVEVHVRATGTTARGATPDLNGTVTLAQIERARIVAVLEEANWLIAGPRGAAARLGMKRTTLQSLIKRLEIMRPVGRYAASAEPCVAPCHPPCPSHQWS